jgi:DNA polymerase-1
MIKLAMIRVHQEMKKKHWESKMILQVHDELVFDAVSSELPALKELILSCMTGAMVLPNEVPVEAEIGVGKNWLEAH